MRKIFISFSMFFIIAVLAACGENAMDNENNNEELEMIGVDFQVPENADVGDTVELKSEVTYKDEPVTDAEVEFEIWLSGEEDNSEMIEPDNNEDGSYTLEYTFDQAGVYEMYAHTTAENMHNMPKKSITIGDVDEAHSEHGEENGNHAEFHTEGFNLHFMHPDHLTVDEETALTSHITLHEEPLENLSVQYEIQYGDDEEGIEWVKTKATEKGEYEGQYTFTEAGEYSVTIHVKDDADLHEHTTETLTVQ